MLKVNKMFLSEKFYSMRELKEGDVVESSGEVYIVYKTKADKKHLFCLTNLKIIEDASRMHFKKCNAELNVRIER